MKLDLNEINKQLKEYHFQVAAVVTGLDAELENQKEELRGIKKLQIELLKLTARVENLEKMVQENLKLDSNISR
jgi:hypothetical protein